MKTSLIYFGACLVLGCILLGCIGNYESGRVISNLSTTCLILAFILLLLCIYIISLRKRQRQELQRKESEKIQNHEQNAVLQKLIDEQLHGTDADIRNTPKTLRWNRIKKEINLVHNHFTTKLQVRFPKLKEEEIQLCCLIRVGMDSYGITRCLDISKEYLRKKRSRLAKTLQIPNQKGQLDRFILEF